MKLSNLSIRRKLTLAITLTSAASLLCAFLGFIGYTLWSERRDTLERLSALAETTAYNVASAIMFDDAQSARETLSALRVNRQVVSATILNGRRETFARYDKSTAHDAKRAEIDDRKNLENVITISHKIDADQKTIGELVIRADLSDMWDKMVFGAAFTLFILLASLLVAFLIGRRIQRIVSAPIIGLADTARKVSSDQDYSLRAEKHNEDEIGELVDRFNEMLLQIQQRDQRLAEHNESLERTVSERTADMARLRDEAVAANRAKSDFLASMSHEIRTPMNAVIGIGSLLARTRLDEKQKEYLEGIQVSARNLLGCVHIQPIARMPYESTPG